MVNSRAKGASAERALIKILREELGDLVDPNSIQRELNQYRQKSLCDCVIGDAIAVEVKSYAQGNWYKEDWWNQAKRSAELLRMIPVLAYRFNRQPWRWTMPIYVLDREYALVDDEHDFPRSGNAMAPITMETETAIMVMREWL